MMGDIFYIFIMIISIILTLCNAISVLKIHHYTGQKKKVDETLRKLQDTNKEMDIINKDVIRFKQQNKGDLPFNDEQKTEIKDILEHIEANIGKTKANIG